LQFANDTNISAAGNPGVYLRLGSETTGFQLANFDAANTSSATQTSYTQSPSGFGAIATRRDEAAAVTDYPLYDGLGSLDRLVNQSQSQIVRAAYDAYGKILVLGDVRLAYVGQPGYYWDNELGLYYVRQRWYDPVTKQWVGPDPIGLAGGDSNLYRYVRGSPLALVDPKGTWVAKLACLCCAGAGGIACAVACTSDPIWDQITDTFSTCFPKCMKSYAPTGTTALSYYGRACISACGSAITKAVLPGPVPPGPGRPPILRPPPGGG
jgi:RHS repeat-associated protein